MFLQFQGRRGSVVLAPQEEVSEESLSPIPLKNKGVESQWGMRQAGTWDLCCNAAVFTPGQTPPIATEYKGKI